MSVQTGVEYLERLGEATVEILRLLGQCGGLIGILPGAQPLQPRCWQPSAGPGRPRSAASLGVLRRQAGPLAYKPFKGAKPSEGRAWSPPRRDRFPSPAAAKLPDDYEQLDVSLRRLSRLIRVPSEIADTS